MGPVCTKKDEAIAILLGGGTPYILRQKGENYRLVEESCVHEIMDKEELKAYEKSGNELEVFPLI